MKKYSHGWVLLYALIYMPWFAYLEKRVPDGLTLIHSPFDDHIPFIEYFVVPYLLWFVFIFAVGLYFFLTDKSGFYRLSAFLITGMTVFLILCTVFPNGQELRPAVFPRENFFTDLVRVIYAVDTPTNVFPSIHVFHSLSVCIAVRRSGALKKKGWVRLFVYTLAALIILSTVFLKQHSVIDAAAAAVMAGVIYPFVYAGQGGKEASFFSEPVM